MAEKGIIVDGTPEEMAAYPSNRELADAQEVMKEHLTTESMTVKAYKHELVIGSVKNMDNDRILRKYRKPAKEERQERKTFEKATNLMAKEALTEEEQDMLDDLLNEMDKPENEDFNLESWHASIRSPKMSLDEFKYLVNEAMTREEYRYFKEIFGRMNKLSSVEIQKIKNLLALQK